MKKSIIVLVIVVALVVVGAVWAFNTNRAVAPENGVVQNGNDLEWKVYKNFGLEIGYPRHWELVESERLSLENFPTEVRFLGDGYIFVVNPNRGMGSYPPSHYRESDIYINNQVVSKFEKIDKKESIEPIAGKHSLVITMFRSDSNFFYPFRLSAPENISENEAKEFMSKFLSAIKVVEL